MINKSQQSGNKSAAALSLATRISEQLMPQMSQMEMGEMGQVEEESMEQPQEQPDPEEQELEGMMEERAETDEFTAKIDVLSQDVTSVKEMLQQLINAKE